MSIIVFLAFGWGCLSSRLTCCLGYGGAVGTVFFDEAFDKVRVESCEGVAFVAGDFDIGQLVLVTLFFDGGFDFVSEIRV